MVEDVVDHHVDCAAGAPRAAVSDAGGVHLQGDVDGRCTHGDPYPGRLRFHEGELRIGEPFSDQPGESVGTHAAVGRFEFDCTADKFVSEACGDHLVAFWRAVPRLCQ